MVRLKTTRVSLDNKVPRDSGVLVGLEGLILLSTATTRDGPVKIVRALYTIRADILMSQLLPRADMVEMLSRGKHRWERMTRARNPSRTIEITRKDTRLELVLLDTGIPMVRANSLDSESARSLIIRRRCASSREPREECVSFPLSSLAPAEDLVT